MPTTDPRPASTPLALAMITTPLFWLVAEAVSPPLKSSSAAQLTVVAAHPTRWYWYTVLLIAGTITLIPAALGLAHLAHDHARRLATAGAALIGFSGIVAVGDAMTQMLTWQMVKPGADPAQMAALLDRYDKSTAASIFFLPGGLALLAGTSLLVTALLRAHTAPRSAALSLGAGLVINLAGFMATSIPIITLGAALMTPGSVLLARRLTGQTAPPFPTRHTAAAATT